MSKPYTVAFSREDVLALQELTEIAKAAGDQTVARKGFSLIRRMSAPLDRVDFGWFQTQAEKVRRRMRGTS